MAACSRVGSTPASGRMRPSMRSRRSWHASCQSPAGREACIGNPSVCVRSLEVLLAQLAVRALGEDADLLLGLAERFLAEARQRDAAFELSQGLLQREFALFEPGHDGFE